MNDRLTNAEVRQIAVTGHEGQEYDNQPYTVHLDDVVGVMAEFGYSNDTLVQLGLLHDIVEDTDMTADRLRELGVDELIVLAVLFLSDEDGHNRKTRKANTYKRVRLDIDAGGEHIPIGLAVKWADRIANLRASTRSNPGLLKMYRKEWEAFRNAYMPPDLAPGIDTRWNTLVAEYDRLIGGPAQ